ncbi:MAG: hypothetical protein L3J96_03065, partial [Thermoplasmata archaeon]|nr:hypothetical protein [Thermoplasmata archaeon]
MTETLPFPEEVRTRLAAGTFLLVDKPRGPTSHQVTSWVRDLLDLDKIAAGKLELRLESLAPRDVVRPAVDGIAALTRQYDISLVE